MFISNERPTGQKHTNVGWDDGGNKDKAINYWNDIIRGQYVWCDFHKSSLFQYYLLYLT